MTILKNKSKLDPLLKWASIVIIIGGLKASSDILTPFFLALFISIVASQPSNWLYKKGVPRSISIILVMLVLLSIFTLIGGLIGGSIGQFTQNLPNLDLSFKKNLSSFVSKLDDFGFKVSSQKLIETVDPGKIMGYLATTINSMGNILGQIFIIVLIALFMLFELDNFPTKYHIISHNANKKPNFDFNRMINNVRNYLGIKTLTSFATGLLIALGLKLIGVQYAFFWGLLAFLMNYIPNIGSLIAAIPAVLIVLIENSFADLMWTIALYGIVNLVIGNIVEPKLMGNGLGLSTLVVLLSLIFWGWVFGPVGMFLSVPFTMVIKIVLETNDSSKWLSVLLDSEQNTNKQWKEIVDEKAQNDEN
jgi:predicted PurR-regulated permease PerM